MPPLRLPKLTLALCRLLFVLSLLFHLGILSAAVPATKSFKVPAGLAETSLRQFVAQAGVEVLFATRTVGSVRTNEVRGDFTAHEALDRLLAGTGLIAEHDGRANTWTVLTDPNAVRAAPKTPGDRPNAKTAAEGEAIQLSPFEVNTSRDTSYGALNSNSITRFNTELAKMPVSAEIFTKAFMDDVAASSVEELILNYVAGAGFASGDDSNAADLQPGDRAGQTSIQLRGLALPKGQRDGFMPLGSVGYQRSSNFDIERVEVIRGPQALLYGPGGAGGVINVTSKMAHFGRDEGSLLYRVNQYGGKQAVLDVNVGAKNLAVRASFLREDKQERRLNIGGPINGQYVQFAAKAFGSTTLRLSLAQTKFLRSYAGYGGSYTIVLPNSDPRNGYKLHYLLATDQAGASNPVTGAAYSGGALFNGRLDWGNIDSFGGWMAGELSVNDYVQFTADTKWNRWLSTQLAVGYNEYWDDNRNSEPALRGPGANSNPLTTWAAATTMANLTLPSRSKGIRFSAVVTNELLRGAAHSQTIIGTDFWRTMGAEIAYRMYAADGDFKPIVNPAVSANNGLTVMPQFSWSLADGVVRKPVVYPFADRATVGGVNYVRLLTNPPNAALRSADNPLGVTLGGGSYVITKVINKGIFGANTTSWLNRRLETLLGFRYAVSDSDRLDQQTGLTHKRALWKTTNFNAGANYALLSWLRPYVGFSDSNQPPPVLSPGPRGNLPKPAHGLGTEIGLKFADSTGTISGSIAAYVVNSRNEEFRVNATLRDAINPTGLNGSEGTKGVWVNADRKSQGLELVLTAVPAKNWRARFSVSMSDGKVSSTRVFEQVYNDQFYARNGAVTYADGTPVWVPTTPTAANATRTAGAAGAMPLTIALMNDRTSPYWANPQPVTSAIATGSAVATVLRSTDPVHGPILTGVAGLPISDLQIAPNSVSPPPGTIPVSLSGEKTTGYPLYSLNSTHVYNFTSERLRGFKIGGTASLGWKYRNFYYYPDGIVPGASRTMFSYPTQVAFDLLAGYTRKMGRITVSTQLNVANLFNRHHILVIPDVNNGYKTASLLNATFDRQPREVTWTNEIRF